MNDNTTNSVRVDHGRFDRDWSWLWNEPFSLSCTYFHSSIGKNLAVTLIPSTDIKLNILSSPHFSATK